jgi:hypothetical protein
MNPPGGRCPVISPYGYMRAARHMLPSCEEDMKVGLSFNVALMTELSGGLRQLSLKLFRVRC